MTNNNPLYHERLKRFNTALKKQKPDIVPIFPIIEQWAQYQSGISIVDSYVKDPMLNFEAYKKIYDMGVYVDISYGTGNLIPIKMFNNFGGGIYKVDENGVQIKGSHGLTMEAEEYPDFINDAQGFIMEKILPRKYPVLNDKENAVELWYKSMQDFLDWLEFDAQTVAAIEEKCGVPVVCKGGTYLPPDVVLDFMRDFVGTSTDIRRHPQDFYDACETLYPLLVSLAKITYPNPGEEGVLFFPLHLPTYLRPKDFEKFYFPFMKRMTEDVLNMGYRPMYYCENDWEPYLELLQDLPDGDIYMLFEGGNLKKIKDKIGHKVCIGGGMPINILQHGSKEQCIDAAKKCLDELAPGGGYVFSCDMNLINKGDSKLENLIAVCDYVHTHGRY
ncbi:MAG: uroporphyrinogen decarboxylase family protein [Eubacteriaceae bacterium]